MKKAQNEILKIFCVDVLTIKDKMTFDSCMVQGIQVTYWMDDDEDIKKRITGAFAILFEEVMKTRKAKVDKEGVKN